MGRMFYSQGYKTTLTKYFAIALIALSMLAGQNASASVFNGVSDYGTDAHGWYYAISGGKFPNGPTPNGDNASGGTFRFVADNSADWGRNPAESGLWQKDDWFSINAGIALTLKNGGAIVYDNNGLEDNSVPANYYTFQGLDGNGNPNPTGAVTAYSMSNNFDWIYAGFFDLTGTTTITSLTGYFAFSSNPNDPLTAGFDPNDPSIKFRMNIWSNVTGNLLPTDTGSFDGDVFSSDSTAGTFSWSDTMVDRVGSSSTQDIYRLTYTLNDPITLSAGTYWFSHDASITPEPMSLAVWSLLVFSIGGISIWHRRNAKRNDVQALN
jgi:hypothetical protein